jgi:hypothetical protein
MLDKHREIARLRSAISTEYQAAVNLFGDRTAHRERLDRIGQLTGELAELIGMEEAAHILMEITDTST